MSRAALLEVSGLVKRYGGLVAIDHVDLALEPGTDHRRDRPERRRQIDARSALLAAR